MTATVHPPTLDAAAAALAAGELLIVPTETVYGLVARLDRPAAVAALYAVKGRPASQPLQVLVGTPDEAAALAAGLTAAERALAAACWPGPLTLVVAAGADLPSAVCAADGSVGLRCPAHPWLTALLAASGPLAASSANRAGAPPPTTAAAALAGLAPDVTAALDAGPCVLGQPSTVARVEAGRVVVVRAGALAAAALQQVVDDA